MYLMAIHRNVPYRLVKLPHFNPRNFSHSPKAHLWKPIVLAVMLLPLGVWQLSAKQQGSWGNSALVKCRSILKPWNFSAAVQAGHAPPSVSLNWLHASVTGVVPSLADRESIRLEIDQLEGIQCKEKEVSGLSVTPHLEAKRENGTLHLMGELSNQESLEQAVQLLKRAEPTVVLNTSAVTVHRAVLPIVMPQRVQDAATFPFLAKVWKEVNFAWPTLEFDFTGSTPRVHGIFPDAKLRDTVLTAVKQARPDLKMDDRDVVLRESLPPVDFAPPKADGWSPPEWMKDAWENWTAYPALELSVGKGSLKLNGVISNPTLLNNVLSLLHRMRPDLDVTKGNLQICNGSLDKPMLLPSDLRKWTAPPWLQPIVDQLATIPKPPAST
jgi:hypothetical protein